MASCLFFSCNSENSAEHQIGLPPHVDAMVLKEMKETFDYEYSEVIQCVQRNKPGSILATYHLIKKKNSKISKAKGIKISEKEVIMQRAKCEYKESNKQVHTEKALAIKTENSKCRNCNENSANAEQETKLPEKLPVQADKYFELLSDPDGKKLPKRPFTRPPNFISINGYKNSKNNFSETGAELEEKFSKLLIISESDSENASESHKKSSALIFPKPQFQNKNTKTRSTPIQNNPQLFEILATKCSKTKQENPKTNTAVIGNQMKDSKLQKSHGKSKNTQYARHQDNRTRLQQEFLYTGPILLSSQNGSKITIKKPAIKNQLSVAQVNRYSVGLCSSGRVQQQVKCLETLEKSRSQVKTYLPPVAGSASINNTRRKDDVTNRQLKRFSCPQRNEERYPVLLSRRWRKIYKDQTSFQLYQNSSTSLKKTLPISNKPKRTISKPIAAAISILLPQNNQSQKQPK